MLNAAVIGAGHMGAHHARVYARLPGVCLVAVCDPDRARGEALAGQHRAAWAASPDRLPPGIAAVSVCVPTHLHRRVAGFFLAKRVAVLLEKPIAATVAEAGALVRLSQSNRTVFQVGHVERFNPAVRALADRLARPRFLEIHRLGPFKNRGIDVSVVTDLMIHDLDLALTLVPDPVERVDALGISAFTGRADIATARLFFAGGAVANLTASRISDKSLRKVRVFEADRYWSLDCERRELVCCRRNPTPPPDGGGAPDLAGLIVRETVPIAGADPLEAEIAAFLAAVRGERRPEVTGEDGLRALRLARRIERCIARAGD